MQTIGGIRLLYPGTNRTFEAAEKRTDGHSAPPITGCKGGNVRGFYSGKEAATAFPGVFLPLLLTDKRHFYLRQMHLFRG